MIRWDLNALSRPAGHAMHELIWGAQSNLLCPTQYVTNSPDDAQFQMLPEHTRVRYTYQTVHLNFVTLSPEPVKPQCCMGDQK